MSKIWCHDCSIFVISTQHSHDPLDPQGRGSNAIPTAPGDKIIGKTKSGKLIYDTADHPAHKDFTKEDHRDAEMAQSAIVLNLQNAEDQKPKPDFQNPEHLKKVHHHYGEARKHRYAQNPYVL